MQPLRSVRVAAIEFDAWYTFVSGVERCLDPDRARVLLGRLGALPVKSSRACGLLGSYVHRGGEPLHIRLQPLQEPEQMRTTLLHELAHACDHLTSAQPRRHRCTHGAGWRMWALAFGIEPRRSGRSAALAALRLKRLKPVAVCERCGCVFQRLRCLPARRSWIHPECGNGRVVPLSANARSRG